MPSPYADRYESLVFRRGRPAGVSRVPSPTNDRPVEPERARASLPRADHRKLLALRRRRLPFAVVPPAHGGAVEPQGAGMRCKGERPASAADRSKPLTLGRRRLPFAVVPPAHGAPVRPQGAGVLCSRANHRKPLVLGRRRLPCVVAPPTHGGAVGPQRADVRSADAQRRRIEHGSDRVRWRRRAGGGRGNRVRRRRRAGGGRGDRVRRSGRGCGFRKRGSGGCSGTCGGLGDRGGWRRRGGRLAARRIRGRGNASGRRPRVAGGGEEQERSEDGEGCPEHRRECSARGGSNGRRRPGARFIIASNAARPSPRRRLPGEDESRVWSISCFYVPRRLRRNGLMERLIEAAVSHARANGASVVEAHPVEADSPSYRFCGFVPVFAAHGFEETGKAGTRRRVMRRRLA